MLLQLHPFLLGLLVLWSGVDDWLAHATGDSAAEVAARQDDEYIPRVSEQSHVPSQAEQTPLPGPTAAPDPGDGPIFPSPGSCPGSVLGPRRDPLYGQTGSSYSASPAAASRALSMNRRIFAASLRPGADSTPPATSTA